MRRTPHIYLALAAVVLLIVACDDDAGSKNKIFVKADQKQVVFFHRPLALAAARASPTPYPLIVLLTSDPWLMVVGSDSPAFVLYSDGTAIFRTKSGFESTKLDHNQRADLIGAFANPELAALAGGYDAASATDQPENTLLVYGNKGPFYISVYGSLDDESVREKVPTAITKAFDQLRGFRPSTAQVWWPDKVEVMIWPYEYATDRSIVWPKRWPGLDDPVTRKRGDSYSLFISSAELPALRTFLASRKEKGAIEIDGKKFAASVRLPFPHEALWMAPAT
ncbi:hypothetical protein BV98_001713 [Sphingobium herbicidovorans NBRC 16415]|uniref:Lipoprotein n=1 Tax=Sphingobium herbicidovorans (strain ATCC 700291 / DSM 11019 / CCUG 56400 / KCTC 2939 / LMG 18315 / NBRC 16415 / MH) TaxID=1219045 RepID=A0A086PAU1_SPHHM|nr:hypothetical protein [Sphingobium herbicidovorans]KFG90509.1 hypothetical protein BV98_001713 [Sphingobium herbicidovorans NBRC 16415]